MSPVALVRDLRLHLRAWERHRVRFGVVCSRHRLPLCRPLFSAACTGLPAADLSLLDRTDPGIALSVIVPDDSLICRFSYGHPNPRWRGKRNPHFLKGKRFAEFLRVMPGPVQAVILPISQIYRTEEMKIDTLVGLMDAFFRTLPDALRYAVEIQNSGYLLPGYFDLMVRHDIAHVLNDSAAMPSLLDQIQIPQVLTAHHVVVRTTAANMPEWKLGLLEIVRRCVSEKKKLSVYLAEGETISVESAMTGLMELLSPDLAKLSPLRRTAA